MMQLTKHYRYMLLLLFLSLFIMTACGAQPELYSEQVVDVGVQVFVFPGGTEKRLISDEKIEQDNCNGSAETSQTVTRQHTVQYTMEVGSGLTVNAEGKVGVPGVGEVGVGTEVATHYKVGYGRQEAVTRSQTVAASPNSHIQHTIQQFEIWETGEVLIVAGDQNQRLPYSFRRDFSIEAVAPANIGCPGTSSNSISDSTAIPPVTQALTSPPQNDLVTTVATTSPPDQLINLLQNPSFENGTQGWEFSDQIELVSGNSGATVLQSTKSTDSAWGWVGLAQEIPVNPGHQYSFTAYLNWTNATQLHMKVMWYDSSRRETPGPQVMGGTDGTSGQWARKGGTVLAPNDAQSARIIIWHGMKNESAVTGGVVQIDEVIFAEIP